MGGSKPSSKGMSQSAIGVGKSAEAYAGQHNLPAANDDACAGDPADDHSSHSLEAVSTKQADQVLLSKIDRTGVADANNAADAKGSKPAESGRPVQEPTGDLPVVIE